MAEPPIVIAGQSSFSLDGYRFQQNPQPSKGHGKYVKLSQKYLRTATGGVNQSWAPVNSDVLQKMQWKEMTEEMYAEIDTRYQAAKSSPTLRFNMTFHDENPEQVWSIKIYEFSGMYDPRIQMWLRVRFAYRLMAQVT